jgi:hypothetical protein
LTIQQIIESLLRSRLYRTAVTVEMDSGATHSGCVAEIRYDGSRSVVLLEDAAAGGEPTPLLLAHVSRVEVPAGTRSGAA